MNHCNYCKSDRVPGGCVRSSCECHQKPQQKEKWEEEFDKTFLKEFLSADCTCGEFHATHIKTFISSLLAAQIQSFREKVEGMRELHRHNSIPSYTADVDEGCINCIKNAALTDILNQIKEV